jgi:hypothetical protein
MGFLSADELRQLLPAETSAFPSPIPPQSVSSDEVMPAPQTHTQREFKARIKDYGSELARHPRRKQRSALDNDCLAQLKHDYDRVLPVLRGEQVGQNLTRMP